MTEYQRAAEQSRRDQLVVDHLSLVRHVLGRIIGGLPPGVDLENLESAGVLGLVEAAGKFDPSRGTQFSTFAYARIRGAILDELRRNSVFPQQVLERIAAIRNARRELPAAGLAELSKATGLTEDEVADTLNAMRLSRMMSWDQTLESAQRTQPQTDAVEASEDAALLARAIEALPERSRLALTMYYREGLRLKEISAVIGVSESRVSRILGDALEKLRVQLLTVGDPAALKLVRHVAMSVE